MNVNNWMMFGTFAEQRHFAYPTRDPCEGAIIDGNMVAHAPDGLATFLLEKTSGLKYIIDPLNASPGLAAAAPECQARSLGRTCAASVEQCPGRPSSA